MNSYKFGSFSSWKSEDVNNQNKIIGNIIIWLGVLSVIILFIFLFA